MSFIGAFIHILTIYAGPDWYRFFGAGEEIAQLAEQGHWFPPVACLVIGGICFTWGLYALAGARVIKYLPWTRGILFSIAAVLIFRNILFFPIDLSIPFDVWTFVMTLSMGLSYLYGGLTYTDSKQGD
tara:strand:+ start:13252 stop:13635 length:384 start_codon:yes stop_codon:yes gene_type:complete